MQDMQAQLAKLREQAAEFDRIASRATDADKHELFARLAAHFLVLASELEKAIAKIASKE
ncbi:hypothetical protein [Bradyrhizobium erythrophlei]|uniref:Uncharacterized protein n=1 Tax=Bradyrhizobium erythrophlei TaxID=1437360 RepID=A0A1M7T719_9BRAD|nr:hypothetical protein [Bradyrhizobium erythrophlei]SHN66528.1 hypothetical protein SAMN05444170_0974 [Bradyrhizobium erythrophlei]